MRSVRVRAPAKINWTLEVLGKRPDGYHEVRTILQTISLWDEITLFPADELLLHVNGATRSFRKSPPEENLAYRAAALLRDRTGYDGGARITLQKNIPVAAGLGGGSSDAAAVLRGLRKLWEIEISDEELAAIAEELGSDVPFFLRGGAALASGRGEVLTPLPDEPTRRLVIVWSPQAAPIDKTARMYAALSPKYYTNGSTTDRLAARLRAGEPVRDEDISNVFEALLPEIDPEAAAVFEPAAARDLGRPHLCGSGPASFFLLKPDQKAEPLLDALQSLGLQAVETHPLAAAEAVALSEVR